MKIYKTEAEMMQDVRDNTLTILDSITLEFNMSTPMKMWIRHGNMQQICWHGTRKQEARQIVKEGLKEGSYLAAHLEDAIAFGGNHVIEFQFDKILFEGWQHITTTHINPAKIRSYKVYKIKEKYRKKEVRP